MAWTAVELFLDAQVVTTFADALLENGALSIDVTDAQAGTASERAIYLEPDEEAALAWGDNRVVALFELQADTAAAVRQAATAAGMAQAPEYRHYRVDDQDWVSLTRSQFRPIKISDRLWVVPSWHAAPDTGAINILLDPGLAFGTGSHPTTWLCLDWLDRNLQAGQSVIDYGCGSGILSIAAARLGASSVIGVDIDTQAVETSRYNAGRNRVNATFVSGDTTALKSADVVIANILSGPLKVLAPLLSRLTRTGGQLVLSGVLQSQADELMQIYRTWFDMRAPVAREGWVRLEGVRRGD